MIAGKNNIGDGGRFKALFFAFQKKPEFISIAGVGYPEGIIHIIDDGFTFTFGYFFKKYGSQEITFSLNKNNIVCF